LTATCSERMLHPFGVVGMRCFLAIGFCTIVAGCSSGTSERLAYQESPDERMTRIVLAGRQECETKFPTSPRHNHLAQAQCVVEFKERVVMPQDQFPDLIGKLNATSLGCSRKAGYRHNFGRRDKTAIGGREVCGNQRAIAAQSRWRSDASADSDRASRPITSNDRSYVGAESVCRSGSRSVSGSHRRALQVTLANVAPAYNCRRARRGLARGELSCALRTYADRRSSDDRGTRLARRTLVHRPRLCGRHCADVRPPKPPEPVSVANRGLDGQHRPAILVDRTTSAAQRQPWVGKVSPGFPRRESAI
jgi:hypothetical protein